MNPTATNMSGHAALLLKLAAMWRRARYHNKQLDTPAVQPDAKFAENSHLGDLYTESGQTLQGSFSAVSKPIFASNIT